MINIIADDALVAACALDKAGVDADLVGTCAADLRISKPKAADNAPLPIRSE